jgi:hypothetical protein
VNPKPKLIRRLAMFGLLILVASGCASIGPSGDGYYLDVTPGCNGEGWR